MQLYADDTIIYADVMLKQQAACKLTAAMANVTQWSPVFT